MLTTAKFIVRVLFALLVVFAAYNPSGYSYYHWVREEGTGDWTVKVFAGMALAFLWFIHLQATWRSLGRVGIPLAVLTIAAQGWVLWDYDLIDLVDPTNRAVAILTAFGLLLGIGLSFSLLRYRLSGQLDSQDISR